MKLNMFFTKEIQHGHILSFHEGRLFHIDINGDTLTRNDSRINETYLEIHGSDWVYFTDIVEQNDSVLVLKQVQRITYEIRTEPPPNDLFIYLSRIEQNVCQHALAANRPRPVASSR
jgi:hypothetical protein